MKDFEKRLARLEKLAENMKKEDIKMDDAIKDFEEGMKLARTMEAELNAIEGKIQILMNDPLEDDIDETKTGEKSNEGENKRVEKQVSESSKRRGIRALDNNLSLPELSLFASADEMINSVPKQEDSQPVDDLSECNFE